MDDPTSIAAILAALANGDDPFTGLPLPAGHVLTDVRVKAALAAAAARIDPEMRLDQVSWRETSVGRPATAGRVPRRSRGRDDDDRHGKAWTDDEIQRLIEGSDAGRSTADLAAGLGRTAGAVRSRLVHLGLLTVVSPVADVRFLVHFERGHLLGRALDDAVLLRAATLLAATDPDGAAERLAAALAVYAARPDAPADAPTWDVHALLARS